MKKYESKLANVPGQILWSFCLYALIALILGLFFHLTNPQTSTLSTFIIVVGVWLGQSWRFHKMYYKINEDALIQYDFQSRTILIDQILTVRILKSMKWVSFHTPYNMVIETIDKQKYYIAPQDVISLTENLKIENPEIKFVQE